MVHKGIAYAYNTSRSLLRRWGREANKKAASFYFPLKTKTRKSLFPPQTIPFSLNCKGADPSPSAVSVLGPTTPLLSIPPPPAPLKFNISILKALNIQVYLDSSSPIPSLSLFIYRRILRYIKCLSIGEVPVCRPRLGGTAAAAALGSRGTQ